MPRRVAAFTIALAARLTVVVYATVVSWAGYGKGFLIHQAVHGSVASRPLSNRRLLYVPRRELGI